jgi:hypothetical protein
VSLEQMLQRDITPRRSTAESDCNHNNAAETRKIGTHVTQASVPASKPVTGLSRSVILTSQPEHASEKQILT